jgi:hypothetical protein
MVEIEGVTNKLVGMHYCIIVVMGDAVDGRVMAGRRGGRKKCQSKSEPLR